MPGEILTAAEVQAELECGSRWDLDESSQLFVALSKTTGQYMRRANSWLYGQSTWIEAAKPSVEKVQEMMQWTEATFGNWWTDDLQRADIWQRYWIVEYSKYLSDDIVFQKVNVNAR